MLFSQSGDVRSTEAPSAGFMGADVLGELAYCRWVTRGLTMPDSDNAKHSCADVFNCAFFTFLN
jgi:hypothetical protein